MASKAPLAQCPDDRLREAIAVLQADDHEGLAVVRGICVEYPADARIRFLYGSLLAGLGEYADARSEMREALTISPDYAIARFQLGLLELSSGDAMAAEATWRPLNELPPRNALRVLAGGLRSLALDRFPEAIEALERGIALNAEHPTVNADMRLLIDGAKAAMEKGSIGDEETSAAHILLQQYAAKPTKH